MTSIVAASALGLSCGDKFEDTPEGCEAQAGACAEGTTCWLIEDGSRFECLPSGAGQLGDPCPQVIYGQPSCANGLFCLSTTDATKPRVCAPQCGVSGASSCDADTERCYGIRFDDTPLLISACGPR